MVIKLRDMVFTHLLRPRLCAGNVLPASTARGLAMLSLLLLSGCMSIPAIIEPKDSAPMIPPHPESLTDAIPREEMITRAGNKNPYTVLGKTYYLLPSSSGYQAEGVASWYGTKFHGRPTANGERYSLYAMTAAHKTLPIPAYVKVTNLENGRTVVVRVNDRGPFHSDRIIDLSYAAAVKLGYADRGTARVRVEAIDPGAKPEPPPAPLIAPERYFLQVAAFKSLASANQLKDELVATTRQRVQVSASEPGGFYRVQVGPLDQISKVEALSELLIEAGHGQPRLLQN